MYGWEVRQGHVITMLTEDLLHTLNVQLVLKKDKDERYCPVQHKAVEDKLRILDVTDPSVERERRRYLDRVLFPKLDLHARAPKRCHTAKHSSEQDQLSLTTTWQQADKHLHTAAFGSLEDLGALVQHPETFKAGVKHVAIVVQDATPLWVKLKGSQRVLIHGKEVRNERVRRNLRRRLKKQNRCDPDLEKLMADKRSV